MANSIISGGVSCQIEFEWPRVSPANSKFESNGQYMANSISNGGGSCQFEIRIAHSIGSDLVSCQFENRNRMANTTTSISSGVASPANSKFEWPIGLLLMFLSVVIGCIGGIQILFTTIPLITVGNKYVLYIIK
jgi:hypothetical protein